MIATLALQQPVLLSRLAATALFLDATLPTAPDGVFGLAAGAICFALVRSPQQWRARRTASA